MSVNPQKRNLVDLGKYVNEEMLPETIGILGKYPTKHFRLS
jgi:hypothetical protein